MHLYLVEPQWESEGEELPHLVELRCHADEIGAKINSLYGSCTGYFIWANLDRLIYE